MRSLLPVNLDIQLKSECWNFIRLAALLSDEKFLPWYVEKFNYYYVDEQFFFNYIEWRTMEFVCNYDEVLSFEDIRNTTNIIESVIAAIDKEGYVILYYDRFYVKGTSEYQKEHKFHDMLVHGYDTTKKVIHLVDINIDGVLWGSHEKTFEEVKCAFESCINNISEKPENWDWIYQLNLPASIFYIKKEFNRSIRLETFYTAIVKTLRGGEVTAISENETKKFTTKRYGISIYKSYYKDLYRILRHENSNYINEIGNEFILYKMKALIECKKSMIDKLNYFNKTGIISFSESIISRLEVLYDMLQNAFLLLSKYSHNLNYKYLDQAKEEFIKSEKFDYEILEDIRINLGEYMKDRISRLKQK